MSSQNTDYATTCFRHSTLTKIHGELTYNGFNCLRNQIKASLTSAQRNLFEGNNKQLGL